MNFHIKINYNNVYGLFDMAKLTYNHLIDDAKYYSDIEIRDHINTAIYNMFKQEYVRLGEENPDKDSDRIIYFKRKKVVRIMSALKSYEKQNIIIDLYKKLRDTTKYNTMIL
jgi:hypothetical protein